MDTQQEGKAEKNFKSFGKKVDEFMIELNEAGEKLHQEFEKKYEELKISAEKFKNEAENKERWREVEASLKRAGDELATAFRAAFKKKEN